MPVGHDEAVVFVGHCFPAGHEVHEEDPAVEYSPLAQATGSDSGSGHSLPAGQSTQFSLFASDCSPEAHLVHEVFPAADIHPFGHFSGFEVASVHIDPAGHSEHWFLPVN